MAKPFRVIDTGIRDGRRQIAFDQALIELRKSGAIPDTIRFLRFPPTALIGRHQALSREVRLDYCRSRGIRTVRRITGGGALYFDEGQLGWELVFDRATLGIASLADLTRAICEAAAAGLSRLGVDAKYRPRSDIEVGGRKISGSGGFFDESTLFYQGTVLADLNPADMLAALKVPAAAATPRVVTLKELRDRAGPELRAVEERTAGPELEKTRAQLLKQVLEERCLSLGTSQRSAPARVNGDLPDLPAGWCWASVDQLTAPEPHAITDGPFGSNLKTSHYTQSGPRVIRLQNVGDGVFINERAHISTQHYEGLKKHSVAVAALGEDLPRACRVPQWVIPAIVKADCIRFRPHPKLDGGYLNLALNAPPTRARVSAIIHGVGRPRLNLTEIKSIALPLPPALEQRRIAVEASLYLSIVEAIGTQIDNALARSDHLRRAVLAKAFNGYLVEQDPSDEPALVLLERIRAAHGTHESAPVLLEPIGTTRTVGQSAARRPGGRPPR